MQKNFKAVKAIIKSDKGKILLLRRNQNEESWDLPGGIVEEDETEERALIREVLEELGLGVEILGKGGTWSFSRFDGAVVIVQNYHCLLLGDGVIVLSGEHTRFEWVYPEELYRYNVKDSSFFEALKTFAEEYGLIGKGIPVDISKKTSKFADATYREAKRMVESGRDWVKTTNLIIGPRKPFYKKE